MVDRGDIFLTVFLSSVFLGFIVAQPGQFTGNEGISSIENVGVSENQLSISTLCFRLDMQVSDSQAEVLEQELHGSGFERPQTHEIVEEAADRELRRVEIHSERNGTYYADLVIGKSFYQKKLDIRPSDGILIASSNDIPVFVNDKMIRTKGVNQCLGGSVEL